jgi:hypothetical protein
MIGRFSDPQGGFFDTPQDSEPGLIRPKDLQDNATPCGNSLAYEALIKLAAFTGESRYRDLADQALPLIGDAAMKFPLGFARWLAGAVNGIAEVKQVAILGERGDPSFEGMVRAVQLGYHPDLVLAAASPTALNAGPELLRDRPLINGRATAYVCKGFVCSNPTTQPEELIAQLKG